MAASLLQTTRPKNIILLIKTGLQFYKHRNLLAILRRPRQRRDNRTVAAHTVQCLFNRQHLRVVSRIAYQLHYRVKAFIRMVQQNILLANCCKKVAVLRQLQRTLRHKGLIQPRPHSLHAGKFKEAGRVQRSVDFINLHIRNVKVLLQEFFNTRIIRLKKLQSYRNATFTLAQRLLNLLHEVHAVLFLNIQIAVTRNAERHQIEDMAALEQIVAVAGDNILQEYEGAASLRHDLCDAVQYGRHLNQAHAVLAVRLHQLHRQIQRLVRQEGKRTRSIDSHRRQYRINNLTVIFLQPVAPHFA